MKRLVVDFIREVKYPKWIANVVMVKKRNGKWRMYIDYKDLNKAFPKCCFPSQASNNWSTPQPTMNYSVSWTPICAITKFACMSPIKSRRSS